MKLFLYRWPACAMARVISLMVLSGLGCGVSLGRGVDLAASFIFLALFFAFLFNLF